jgi:hypothetical protein
MSEASDYVENQILNCYLNQGNVTAPTAIYLGLHSADPTDDDGGEISGNGYARVAITDKFDAASGTGGSLSSNADITGFTASGGAWATVTHVGIHTASTAGELLFHTPLASSVTVADGDSFQISSGNLTVTVA